MKTVLAGLFAGFLVSTAFLANASAADIIDRPTEQPPEIVAYGGGFYVAGRIGAVFVNDTEFSISNALGVTVENEYDIDLMGAVAAGYDFGNNFRVELEFSYSEADIDSHRVNLNGASTIAFPSSQSFGDLTTYTGMVNAYYDFDLGLLKPFVGAGIGYGRVKADDYGVNVAGVLLGDSDSGLAYQVGAGINYDLTETLTMEIGYRYQLIEADLESITTDSLDFDFDSHNVYVGLRAKF